MATNPVSGLKPPAIPNKFSAFIGGYLGYSYGVELQIHALVLNYRTLGPFHRPLNSETIAPTREEWREFRQSLDDLQVWDWRESYDNPSILDGTHWSLHIAYEDRALSTGGDNNYPTDYSNPGPLPEKARRVVSEVFIQYLDAVRKLLGGKDFGTSPQESAAERLSHIPELRTLSDNISEDQLKSHIEEYRLYATKKVEKPWVIYWVLTLSGENIFVKFRFGVCIVIQKMEPIPTEWIEQEIGTSEYRKWMARQSDSRPHS